MWEFLRNKCAIFYKTVKVNEEGVSSEMTKGKDEATQVDENPSLPTSETDSDITSIEEAGDEKPDQRGRIQKNIKEFFVERTLLRILLLLLILLIIPYASYILEPVKVFVTTLIMPVVISGVLFYVTSPILRLGMKYTKLPKQGIIAFIYFLLAGIIFIVISVLGPSLKVQFGEFLHQLPTILKDTQNYMIKLSSHPQIATFITYFEIDFNEITKSITDWVTNSLIHLSESIISYVTKISTFIIHLIVVPFMLYYMLKDGDKFLTAATKFLKPSFRKETVVILTAMNRQLNSYVIGQFAVYASVGVMIFVGYNVIDLDYAFLLTFCFIIVNCIPLIGIFIGAIPAVLVALLGSPILALKVVIVITIAHQIDAHLISPQIMGKTLNIHPLTVIIILLVAGTFAGVLGLIFALPLYVVCKVLCINLYRIILLHNNSKKN